MDGPHLIHCSYHKCLTVYYRRVMQAVFNRCLPWSAGYRHYNSHLKDFYEGFQDFRVASVNNRALDLSRLGRCKITRFLRDPRDLVVSGYFYHKRAAEPWMKIENPTPYDWYFANGCIPAGLREAKTSFASYLQSLSEEDGLLAELEFRRFHFESMREWPAEHPDILLFRYEEILGNERSVFARIFEHYGLSKLERTLGDWFARRYSIQSVARKQESGDAHIRNPTAGQWRRHFTPRLREAFEERHPGLIEQLGYAVE